MKKTNTILIAVMAGIALSLFTGSAQAQYKAAGDDGIIASPRQRQFLDEYKRNHSPAPVPAAMPVMACAMCKDRVTERVDNTARGANKPTVRVVTHLCESCGTDWTVVGVGKAKQSVARHKCTSCGAEKLACCNTSKDSEVATKGMEKKNLKDLNFEVAPVK